MEFIAVILVIILSAFLMSRGLKNPEQISKY